MKTKKIWANFSVKDAARTQQFYTRLGLAPNLPNNNPQLASFLFGDENFVIHFFEQGTPIDEYVTAGVSGEIIFTLAAETEAEVQEWMDRVKVAGGTVLHETGKDQGGYYGFTFADPDGHRFNVLLMRV